jgi:hypothetical protein
MYWRWSRGWSRDVSIATHVLKHGKIIFVLGCCGFAPVLIFALVLVFTFVFTLILILILILIFVFFGGFGFASVHGFIGGDFAPFAFVLLDDQFVQELLVGGADGAGDFGVAGHDALSVFQDLQLGVEGAAFSDDIVRLINVNYAEGTSPRPRSTASRISPSLPKSSS